jgi:dTDP-L-rhamnose 4-epimerase
MKGRVLITGGAGFVGSHLCDRLLREGYAVRLFDSLVEQVHGGRAPSYLDPEAELRVGDVRDEAALREALRGVDAVFHFAAAVGVGQSMYAVRHYVDVNVGGSAQLLDLLVRERPPLRRLVVASSMSVYGEGRYLCPACGPRDPPPRPVEQLRRAEWEPRCPACAAELEPCPTPEDKPLHPRSVYAVSKRDQEELTLVTCHSLGLPALALRFFNIYGTRQALSNPYTGVGAIVASALLNRQAPLIFEDGRQQRDFVHVDDVVAACLLALEREDVSGLALNVGSGRPSRLLDLVDALRAVVPGGDETPPQVLGRFREGDVRSCFGDISLARRLLGYEPRVTLREGARALAAWAAHENARFLSADALRELRQHGLVVE